MKTIYFLFSLTAFVSAHSQTNSAAKDSGKNNSAAVQQPKPSQISNVTDLKYLKPQRSAVKPYTASQIGGTPEFVKKSTTKVLPAPKEKTEEIKE